MSLCYITIDIFPADEENTCGNVNKVRLPAHSKKAYKKDKKNMQGNKTQTWFVDIKVELKMVYSLLSGFRDEVNTWFSLG